MPPEDTSLLRHVRANFWMILFEALHLVQKTFQQRIEDIRPLPERNMPQSRKTVGTPIPPVAEGNRIEVAELDERIVRAADNGDGDGGSLDGLPLINSSALA